MTYKLLRRDRNIAVFRVDSLTGHLGYFPFHLRCIPGNSSIDFPVEVLNDFRAALIPPHGSRCHLAAVLQDQRVRKVRIGIRFGFIVVRRVGSFAISAIHSAAKRSKLQEVHQPLPVFLRGKLRRRRWIARWLRCLKGRTPLGSTNHVSKTKPGNHRIDRDVDTEPPLTGRNGSRPR